MDQQATTDLGEQLAQAEAEASAANRAAYDADLAVQAAERQYELEIAPAQARLQAVRDARQAAQGRLQAANAEVSRLKTQHRGVTW